MDEYITKKRAIQIAMKYSTPSKIEYDCWGRAKVNWGYQRCVDIANDIRNAPVEDVRPVVHGEWLLDSDPGEPWRYRCSECGEITKDTCMGKPRANWCPCCGASM